jgi:hypothetical protein
MNLFRVLTPYGVEHECVSPRGWGWGRGVVLHKSIIDSSTLNSNRKTIEAEWRETPTSETGTLFTIT